MVLHQCPLNKKKYEAQLYYVCFFFRHLLRTFFLWAHSDDIAMFFFNWEKVLQSTVMGLNDGPLKFVDMISSSSCKWVRVTNGYGLKMVVNLQNGPTNPIYQGNPNYIPPPIIFLNKALLTPYSWGAVVLGGVVRIPLSIHMTKHQTPAFCVRSFCACEMQPVSHVFHHLTYHVMPVLYMYIIYIYMYSAGEILRTPRIFPKCSKTCT